VIAGVELDGGEEGEGEEVGQGEGEEKGMKEGGGGEERK